MISDAVLRNHHEWVMVNGCVTGDPDGSQGLGSQGLKLQNNPS
jgi:hypothetical protein